VHVHPGPDIFVKVYAFTSSRSHLTLCTFYKKTGDDAKIYQSGSQVVNVILFWDYKYCGVIFVKRGANYGHPPKKLTLGDLAGWPCVGCDVDGQLIIKIEVVIEGLLV
jgi:hypothetical protein